MTAEIMGNRVTSPLARFWFWLIVISLPLNVCPQSKERPKIKDFGSSLKRTRWDPDKQQAVVAKPDLKSKDDEDLDVVKVETTLVSSDVLVQDARGNPVDGLTENDFLISEDGAPQKLGMFSLGTNRSVARSIVLIIDYSGSQLPFIETSIAAAKTLIDKLGPLDQMALVDDDVEMIQDFTTDKKKLKDKLESLRKRATSGGGILSHKRFGESKQYSALFATLNEAFDSEDKRPIVIFQTDGDQVGLLRNSPMDSLDSPDPTRTEQTQKYLSEHRTSFSLEDIHRAAERARVTIYTVMPGFRIIGLSQDEQLKQVSANIEQSLRLMETRFHRKMPDSLRQRMFQPEIREYSRQASVALQTALASVAIASGGWLMFLEKPEQADETYSLILSDINRRYLVGYYPANKEHDGKRRNIAVTIRDHPDYKVIGRKWYYAPAADQ
jgi:VWFA-related protein